MPSELDSPPNQPRYPIYIISKGRWDSRLTSRALESMGTPYHICVEPQEYEAYAAVIDPAKIFVLPFSNLGQGSIPARNWCWDHATEAGFNRHWVMDDNIRKFYRLNKNLKVPVADGTIFRATEDFTERYVNVPESGLQYEMFAKARWPHERIPAFYLNTRIYSCILLQNGYRYRWRGRYNEDTDLSIRILKDGFCTILVNAFLADKMATMSMKGGNTDVLYRRDNEFDGRLEMAKSLQAQHPDVVRVSWKWGRWQHQVNYKPFKNNKLIRRPGVPELDELPSVDEYGMHVITVGPGPKPKLEKR